MIDLVAKMSEPPFVTIIIPTRNEEFHIDKCLKSIAETSYPKDRLEILVIDGVSSDDTTNISKKFDTSFSFFRILTNEKKIFPAAVNMGITRSRGDIIIIFGAHSIYPPNCITNCVNHLISNEVDNVGGFINQVWPETSILGETIILALKSPFGVGGSTFRTKNSSSKPIFVDTVFGGCYRKSIFSKIGLFNENFIFSSDIEFNYRLRKNGGKILFVPEIESTYLYSKARTKFIEFIKHNYRNGYWSVYPLKFVKSNPFSLRHYVPILFVLGLFGPLLLSLIYKPFLLISLAVFVLYSIVNLFYTINIRSKTVIQHFILPFIFFSLHLSYGIASIWAFIKNPSIIFFVLKN